MTELDTEALRRRTTAARLDHSGAIWMTTTQVDAIADALEDRDRLRTTLSRIDAVVERMYLPPEFAHFQAELCRILTLEGRDG